MKIKDLLELPKTKEDYIDAFTNRLKLFDIYKFDSWDIDIYNNNIDRLQVYNLYSDCLDGRRGLWIYSVYFDNEPIALWYEAGREGDDFNEGFIINEKLFSDAIEYLKTFINKEEYIKETNINDYLQKLDTIYGYDLKSILKDIK